MRVSLDARAGYVIEDELPGRVDLNAVITLFLGMTPERPAWLRRVGLAFWLLFVALVVLAWVYGLVQLIRRL